MSMSSEALTRMNDVLKAGFRGVFVYCEIALYCCRNCLGVTSRRLRFLIENKMPNRKKTTPTFSGLLC